MDCLGRSGEIHKELPTGALLVDYGGDEERIAYGQHFAHAHCNSYDRVPIEAAFGTCHAYSPWLVVLHRRLFECVHPYEERLRYEGVYRFARAIQSAILFELVDGFFHFHSGDVYGPVGCHCSALLGMIDRLLCAPLVWHYA